MQVHYKLLAANDTAAAAEVRQLHPDTISWSNVCEFVSPRDFHNLAAACSVPQTTNYMHGMNWVFDIKGSSPLDYCTQPKSPQAQIELRTRIYRTALTKHAEYLKGLGVDHLFRERPALHPVTICSGYLPRLVYGKWLRAFVEEAEEGRRPVAEVQHEPTPWDFVRLRSVMHFSLKYPETEA